MKSSEEPLGFLRLDLLRMEGFQFLGNLGRKAAQFDGGRASHVDQEHPFVFLPVTQIRVCFNERFLSHVSIIPYPTTAFLDGQREMMHSEMHEMLQCINSGVV